MMSRYSKSFLRLSALIDTRKKRKSNLCLFPAGMTMRVTSNRGVLVMSAKFSLLYASNRVSYRTHHHRIGRYHNLLLYYFHGSNGLFLQHIPPSTLAGFTCNNAMDLYNQACSPPPFASSTHKQRTKEARANCLRWNTSNHNFSISTLSIFSRCAGCTEKQLPTLPALYVVHFSIHSLWETSITSSFTIMLMAKQSEIYSSPVCAARYRREQNNALLLRDQKGFHDISTITNATSTTTATTLTTDPIILHFHL